MVRRVFLCLAVAWMALIFMFSAQEADESEETSLAVGRAVASVFVPDYRTMSVEEQDELARKIDHPVRKTAHATEYAVLAVLLWLSLRRYAPSFFITAAYAATDEIHQLFVPGRAGMVTDVLIDSAGGAAALLIVYLISRRRGRR